MAKQLTRSPNTRSFRAKARSCIRQVVRINAAIAEILKESREERKSRLSKTQAAQITAVRKRLRKIEEIMNVIIQKDDPKEFQRRIQERVKIRSRIIEQNAYLKALKVSTTKPKEPTNAGSQD